MRTLRSIATLLLAVSLEARARAVQHPATLISPKSVLWIAAHPDDEAVAAPLLAKWCLQDHARCGFLVLTRGEAGACQLSAGCQPDVATVRTSEAAAAAELFHADSIHLRYRDGGGVTTPAWSAQSTNQPDLVSTHAAYISAFRPEVVLTFDPRHGTTCHPDHRETGRAVLEAIGRMADQPDVYFLETRVQISSSPLSVSFSPASATAERFDATQLLPFAGVEAWTAIVWDMQRHPSQFADDLIAAIRDVPPYERAVYFERAAAALQQNITPCH
jgi:LmbE family N-acetylglucosaminyl deacetylase